MQRHYTKTVTILNPVQHSAAWTSAEQFNNGWTGLRLDIDITALTGTSPTVTYIVESFDAAKGGWVTELQSSAQSATGHLVLQVDPRVAAVANQAAQRILPQRWRVRTTLGGTSPAVTHSILATYSE